MTTELVRPAPDTATSVGFGNVMRSEWTKLRTVRSTYWTAVIAVLATVALGAVICARFATEIDNGKQSLDGFDPTLTSLNGIYLAQVAIGTLGVLMISSEYGTGMIRATFMAVPQRRLVLAAKAMVFAAATFVAGEGMSFAAFGVGQLILGDAHPPTAPKARVAAALGDPDVLRAVFGAGLYLTAVGLLGFGLGALIRHTAGALSAFFGVLFALTVLVDLLPSSLAQHADQLPAGQLGQPDLHRAPDLRCTVTVGGVGRLLCLCRRRDRRRRRARRAP